MKAHETNSLVDADIAFIPINLIELQFRNIDPCEYIDTLPLTKKPHFIVALGDFSNRTGLNRFGDAYREVYPWIAKVHLLALESTMDLLANYDVAIVPFNCVTPKASDPFGSRHNFADFYGTIEHTHLPDDHLRRRMPELAATPPHRVMRVEASPDKFERTLNSIWRPIKRFGVSTPPARFADYPYRRRGKESTFILCPPGYGNWTYRYFLSYRYGGIPVRWNANWIPGFSQSVPFLEAEVLIDDMDFSNTSDILASLSPTLIREKQNLIKETQQKLTKYTYENLLIEGIMKTLCR